MQFAKNFLEINQLIIYQDKPIAQSILPFSVARQVVKKNGRNYNNLNPSNKRPYKIPILPASRNFKEIEFLFLKN